MRPNFYVIQYQAQQLGLMQVHIKFITQLKGNKIQQIIISVAIAQPKKVYLLTIQPEEPLKLYGPNENLVSAKGLGANKPQYTFSRNLRNAISSKKKEKINFSNFYYHISIIYLPSFQKDRKKDRAQRTGQSNLNSLGLTKGLELVILLNRQY